MSSTVSTAPLRALAAALTGHPDDADALIAVPAVHRALWREAYRADPAVSVSGVESLHVVLAAAYHLAGGYISRHGGIGYYHEPTLAVAALMIA